MSRIFRRPRGWRLPDPVGGFPRPEGASTAGEWVESRSLARLVSHVAGLKNLGAEDSEDLLQEVRLALLQRGPDLQVNSTFVFQTAKHKAIDIVREHCRGRVEEWIAAPAVSPELKSLIRARVASLAGPLQVYFRLRFEGGLSQCQISGRLDISRRSVRWLESRLLRALAGRNTRLARRENLSLRKILVAISPRPSD